MCVQRNAEACSGTHSFYRRAITSTYAECVCVAFGIQHEKRMSRVVACPALPYFPTLSKEKHHFRGNVY